jgi:hypothetical protein
VAALSSSEKERGHHRGAEDDDGRFILLRVGHCFALAQHAASKIELH